jgi:PAS domain S-box-containing protein
LPHARTGRLMKRLYSTHNGLTAGFFVFICFFAITVFTRPCHARTFGISNKAFFTEEEKNWIKTHPVIRLAPDPEFKPIEFFDSNGNYTGIAADYVRLIEQKSGIRFTVIRCENWDEVIARTKKREVDVLNAVVKSPQREAFLRFPTPYLKIPSVIIVRKNVERHLTMEQLKGMHVGMVSGYGYADLLKNRYPEILIDSSADLKTALRKVSFGINDAFVGDLATASYYIQSEGITNLKVAGETDPPNISGFAVRSDWPELASILEKSVALLSETEKAAIQKKWIHLQSEAGLTWMELRNLMLIVTCVIAVVILGFLLWNRTLNRMVHLRTQELQSEIEERRRAEEALAESSAHLRTLLNTIPDLVWFKDPHGVYQACNARFECFVGKNEKSIIGKTDYDFFNREKADFFRSHDSAAVHAGKPTMNEETITYADDGHIELLETIKTPVYSLTGKLIGVLGIARDITERKKAEDERQKLMNQLFEARKIDAIGRLAGGVAHDFNNMLSVIIGRSEMARLDLDPSHPLYTDLCDIESVGKRSAELTRQLLAFARRQTIAPEILDLNETIENILKMIRRLIGEGVEMDWRPSSGLWPVKMDPVQIDQILANLIINARDSLIDNRGKLIIETDNCVIDPDQYKVETGMLPGEYVRLTVTDNGCGMDQQTLENIFEPFFTTKELGKGTGLGLSTIYGIVKQNDGFIQVHSEQDKGSSFIIYLPRFAGDRSPAEPTPPQKKAVGGKETILLVEDEPELLNMAKIMLQKLGYQVLSVTNPGEALSLARSFEGEIHLLLTDVVMPEMNGRELANQLLSRFPGLRCLFMSGYTADIIAHHGVLDEGLDFIQKPFTMNGLATKIRAVFHTS